MAPSAESAAQRLSISHLDEADFKGGGLRRARDGQGLTVESGVRASS
jgi:hypothetical protein